MLKPGKIERLENGQAWVKMQKGTSCGDGHCALSSTILDDSGTDFYIVKAKNEISAPTGSDVLVEVKDATALKIAFLIYVLPIILVLGVYLLVNALTSSRILVVGITLLAGFISLIILKRADKTIQPEYFITDYIQDESCSECPFIRKKEDNTTVKSEKV
jgi:positive regulator of sigma E activity